jgi:hypothetical protein
LWGLVRPARGSTRVVVQYSADGGRRWHGLADEGTASDGAWTASGRFVAGRLWRVRWTSPAGQTFTGAPTRAYTLTGALES